MTINYQRLQLMESISSLDPGQAEKVLEYIKHLSYKTVDDVSYRRFKRQAMKEIRTALGDDQLRSSF
jgi:hypothetical protein